MRERLIKHENQPCLNYFKSSQGGPSCDGTRSLYFAQAGGSQALQDQLIGYFLPIQTEVSKLFHWLQVLGYSRVSFIEMSHNTHCLIIM